MADVGHPEASVNSCVDTFVDTVGAAPDGKSGETCAPHHASLCGVCAGMLPTVTTPLLALGHRAVDLQLRSWVCTDRRDRPFRPPIRHLFAI